MKSTLLKHYQKLIQKFSEVKIGVLGDIVADRFVYGIPERLSREAPVPIIMYQSEDLFPGCAGNTIRNLQDLEANVYPIGALGQDEWARGILNYFSRGKVFTDHILQVPGEDTVTKTRILAGDFHTKKQQVVRIDRGKGVSISKENRKKISKAFQSLSKEVDAWIISDYGYNVVDDSLIQMASKISSKVPIIVDSRKRLTFFQKITLITPNEEEAEKATDMKIETAQDVPPVGEKLLEMTKSKAVIITRGNQGMVVFEKGKDPVSVPCYGSLDIVDVTGAGDTVISVATLALAAGGSFEDAARLATYAASVVVMKMGTATCSKEELEKVLEKALGN